MMITIWAAALSAAAAASGSYHRHRLPTFSLLFFAFLISIIISLVATAPNAVSPMIITPPSWPLHPRLVVVILTTSTSLQKLISSGGHANGISQASRNSDITIITVAIIVITIAMSSLYQTQPSPTALTTRCPGLTTPPRSVVVRRQLLCPLEGWH